MKKTVFVTVGIDNVIGDIDVSKDLAGINFIMLDSRQAVFIPKAILRSVKGERVYPVACKVSSIGKGDTDLFEGLRVFGLQNAEYQAQEFEDMFNAYQRVAKRNDGKWIRPLRLDNYKEVAPKQ